MEISEKNYEETIEQALLAALPQVDLNPARLEIGQPAALIAAVTGKIGVRGEVAITDEMGIEE